MTFKDLIEDHGLDVHDEQDGENITAVCPNCLGMGSLQVNLSKGYARCHNRTCRLETRDPRALDMLYRQNHVRPNWKIHPGIKRDDGREERT